MFQSANIGNSAEIASTFSLKLQPSPALFLPSSEGEARWGCCNASRAPSRKTNALPLTAPPSTSLRSATSPSEGGEENNPILSAQWRCLPGSGAPSFRSDPSIRPGLEPGLLRVRGVINFSSSRVARSAYRGTPRTDPEPMPGRRGGFEQPERQVPLWTGYMGDSVCGSFRFPSARPDAGPARHVWVGLRKTRGRCVPGPDQGVAWAMKRSGTGSPHWDWKPISAGTRLAGWPALSRSLSVQCSCTRPHGSHQ